eukprot:gene1874-2536_t
MRIKSARMTALIALVALGACTPLRTHQGYVVDPDLVNSVQPGVDTRQSVLAVLGKPSFASQFNQGDWYYVARDSRNFAYNKPRAREQITLRVTFNRAGVVAMTDEGGGYDYGAEVMFQVRQNNAADYLEAARRINAASPDAVCVQHEFGLFGGPAGEHLMLMLDAIRAPVTTTLHTVLTAPDADQRRVFERMIRAGLAQLFPQDRFWGEECGWTDSAVLGLFGVVVANLLQQTTHD